jgi:Porphyromonas-type peptidyl-arginine deiminase
VTSRLARAGAGIAAGVVAGALVSIAVGATLRRPAPHDRLVPEDASGHLRRVAIHYVPAMDARALPVWRQLFRALPPDVAIEVAVPDARDFAHFTDEMRRAGVAGGDRFHAVVVDHPLTTWSRDRMASLEDGAGRGAGVLAPPRIATATGGRAGDWDAPFAIARDVYHAPPRVSDIVFEGGDFAASRHVVFADANLIGRNLGRGDASLDHLRGAVARMFPGDQLVWLGDAQGDVPEHHIMMYAVPLDDHAVLVGDVRAGLALAGDAVAHDADTAGHAARFDHVAALLAAKGLRVTRVPVVVLPGARSYVTYTNALFDRDAAGPVVYLPTYGLPALDAEATRIYQGLGYRVVPIDVTTIYTLNGSLGCLVNVMDRGGDE